MTCKNAGNDGVRMFRCQKSGDHVLLGGMISYARAFHSVSSFPDGTPREVIDLRSGFRGTVRYDEATVISDDGENGWLMIPLVGRSGDWAMVVFKLEGEYDTYRGLRRL
jgi:hypothetical protein